MWNLQRTKTLASIQRQDINKKHKLSEHVEIALLITEADTLMSFYRLRQFLDNLFVTINTWSLAGCFDVTFEGTAVKYSSWQLATEYAWDIEER
eukprot:8403494-Karenia_brevis.AAC.1